MNTRLKNFVTQVATQTPSDALLHFEAKLTHETDCWDVHSTQDFEERGFLLVDVRSKAHFERGHLPGAVHIPQAQLTEKNLEAYPKELLFVVYCAGPHCNGSTKAAIRLARLGRPVKEMIGGTTGWVDEGFDLVSA